jgi:hypothetical protein
VREHFESEVLVRDAIIHKLNTEIEELNLKLHKTIQVLKIPRLNEIAMKRINFNRVNVSEQKVIENSNQKVNQSSVEKKIE